MTSRGSVGPNLTRLGSKGCLSSQSFLEQACGEKTHLTVSLRSVFATTLVTVKTIFKWIFRILTCPLPAWYVHRVGFENPGDPKSPLFHDFYTKCDDTVLLYGLCLVSSWLSSVLLWDRAFIGVFKVLLYSQEVADLPQMYLFTNSCYFRFQILTDKHIHEEKGITNQEQNMQTVINMSHCRSYLSGFNS